MGRPHTPEALAAAMAEPIAPLYPVSGLGALFSALAEVHPDRDAVVMGEERRSFDEVERSANQLARAFRRFGVEEGSLVPIVLPNHPDFYVVALAVWKLGAIPLPLSHRLPAVERGAILALAEPALTIELGSGEARAAEAPIVGVDRVRAAAVSESSARLPDVPTPRWEATTSGGSTGRPKLIFQENAGPLLPRGAKALGMREGGVQLVAGPLYHAGPFNFGASHLFIGGTVVIMPRFDAETYLGLVASERVTWSFVVPTMMHRIMALSDEVLGRYDLSSLEVVLHGAAACPEWLKRRFLELVPPEVVWEYYGATETPGGMIRGDEWLAHPGSVGKPFAGLEVRILDEDGRPCPPGEIGELYVRPPDGRPSFSYRGAEAKWHGEYLTVGDMGYLDGDGYLYLADRRTDMIVTGGVNVFPAEVEGALLAHPDVFDVAVVGLRDDEWGHRVHAVVQPVDPRRPPSEDELLVFLRERLAAYKLPKSFEFINSLPRDPNGKVRRSQLRDEHRRSPSRSPS